MDISQQKELYDVMFDKSPYGILLIDASTYKFIDANKNPI